MKTELLQTELLEHILGNLKVGNPAGLGLSLEGEASTARSVFDMGLYKGYTMAPRTHMVNRFKVPAPEAEAPKGKYFVVSLDDDDFYWETDWTNHSADKIRLERGLIHLTSEAAIANAKAMIGIDPYKD